MAATIPFPILAALGVCPAEWGNAADPKVYLDENNRRIYDIFRRQFGKLALDLARTGDSTRAVAAAERGLSIVPPEKMQYDYFCLDLVEALLIGGKTKEADELFNDVITNSVNVLNFVVDLKGKKSFGVDFYSGVSLQALYNIYSITMTHGLTETSNRAAQELNRFYGLMPKK